MSKKTTKNYVLISGMYNDTSLHQTLDLAKKAAIKNAEDGDTEFTIAKIISKGIYKHSVSFVDVK